MDAGYSIILRSENNKLSLFLLGTVLFGIYCFVFGQSGILERMRLEKEKESLVLEISYLERENGRLESLYNEYAKGSMTASECESAGFIIKGSRVLFFKDKNLRSNNHPTVLGSANPETAFSIEHFRIGWICISILIVSGFYLVQRMNRRNADTRTESPDEFSS
jgi:hypothetical protein